MRAMVQPFNIRLLVACGVIAIGLTVITLWFVGHRLYINGPSVTTNYPEERLSDEDSILEQIYRYQILNTEGHKSTDLFFLSRGQGADPNEGIVKRLEKDAFHVKVVSSSINTHTVIKDRETGELGVVLSVGKIKKVDANTVEADVSVYSGWDDVKAYTYRLVGKETTWKVEARKFSFES